MIERLKTIFPKYISILSLLPAFLVLLSYSCTSKTIRNSYPDFSNNYFTDSSSNPFHEIGALCFDMDDDDLDESSSHFLHFNFSSLSDFKIKTHPCYQFISGCYINPPLFVKIFLPFLNIFKI